MPHFLLHKHTAGHSLRYVTVCRTKIEAPGQQTIESIVKTEQTQTAISENAGLWRIDFVERLIPTDEQPADYFPEPLKIQKGSILMDAAGTTYDPNSGKVMWPTSFPSEAVDTSSKWTARGIGDEAIHFEVHSIEEKTDDVLVNMLSESSFSSTSEAEPTETVIRSRSTFSVTRGCPVRAQTLVVVQWPNGRISTTISELELIERGKLPTE